ncbi:MAG TPA: IPT/TIG domain-containing protein, partial [Anaeromyxobacter sp.]
MRRALVPAVALAAAACARDLEMPSSSPPRVDSVQVVGLEAKAPPVPPLRVVAGELVAIRGGGFPRDAAQLEVRIGGVDAEVKDIATDRLVVRVPSLAATGTVDLQVTSPVGFRTAAGALRYDGAGQPPGFGTSDLSTSVALGFVAPVQPPSSTGFPDLAIAIGSADSALLVVPSVGVAATTIPLGLVPSSAAARIVSDGTNLRVQVLALARGGEAALGSALLDKANQSVTDRVQAKPLTTTMSTKACT